MNWFKIAQGEEALMISGPGINSMLSVVQQMLERGAPVELDYLGGSGVSYPVFRDISSKYAPGNPVLWADVIRTMNALKIHKNTQLPTLGVEYDELREQVAEDYNKFRNLVVQTKEPDNKIIFMEEYDIRGFKKLDFQIKNLNIYKKYPKVKQAIRDEMARRVERGQRHFQERVDNYGRLDYPIFMAMTGSGQNLDSFAIDPSFVPVIEPALKEMGYDTSEMASYVEQAQNSQVSEHIAGKLSVRLDGTTMIMDFNGFPGKESIQAAKDAGFRGKKEDSGNFIWINNNPDLVKLTIFAGFMTEKSYDTTELIAATLESMRLQQEIEEREEEEGIGLEIRDVTGETNNRWHMAVKFLRRDTYGGEELKKILKYSFVEWSGSLLDEEGTRSINKDTWETYVAGNLQEYLNFINSLNNRGFNSQPVSDILKELMEKKLVAPTDGMGFLDGYDSKEDFYAELDKYDLPFELYPDQKEGISKAYSRKSYMKGWETGTGKCVLPFTRVFVNDTPYTIEEIWDKFSTNIYSYEKNEEWGNVLEDLHVLSVNENGEIVKSRIIQLFKQKYQGLIRIIKTSYGKKIYTSPEHKFLSPEGKWINDIERGSVICAPTKKQLVNKEENFFVDMNKEESSNIILETTTRVKTSGLQHEKIIGVEYLYYNGYIYDLSIENYHNYIAEGLITHNTVGAILAADMRMKQSGGRTLILTKNRVVPQYKKAIAEFLHSDINDVSQISSNPLDKAKWTVMSYTKFGARGGGQKEPGQLNGRKEIRDELVRQGQDNEISVCILDECHTVKNGKPANRDVSGEGKHKSNHTTFNVQDVTAQIPFTWGTSATIVANRAIDVYNQLKAINHPLGKMSYNKFAIEFGGMRPGRYGLEPGTIEEQVDAVNNLKSFLFDQGAYDSLSKKQLREDLPDQIVTQDYVQVNTQALWRDIGERLKTVKDPYLAVTQQQVFRNKVAIHKAPLTIEKAKEALNKGKKVMIFTDFRDSHSALMNGLKEYFKQRNVEEKPVFITGGMNEERANTNIDLFKDPSSKARAIVLNIVAGGTGLDFPNVTENVFVNDFDWSVANDEQALGRAYRINSEKDVHVSYTLAEGTPDVELYERMSVKKELADIIHKMSMEQDALLREGKRRDRSKQLRELEEKLNAAKIKYIKMEEQDANFEQQISQSIRHNLRTASEKNWFKSAALN